MRSILAGATVALIVAFYMQAAQGQDAPKQEEKVAYPVFTVDGYIESRFDDVPRSDDPNAKKFDLNPKGEADFDLLFDENLSAHAHVTGESVKASRSGRDRYISGTGVYLQELYLKYQTDDFSVYGGKFGAPFGIGWDMLPDLVKDGFSGDYETTEMDGIGGSVTVRPEGFGEHTLSAAAFFADTSFLHYSLFSSPGSRDPQAERISHLRRNDGGLGNTEKFNNFSITLGGDRFGGASQGGDDEPAGFFYNVGFRYLSAGVTETREERGLAAAVGYRIRYGDDTSLTPFAEYVHFWDFSGAPGSADIMTLGLLANIGPWEAATSVAWRSVDSRGGGALDHDDYLFAMQAAYNFDNGLYLGAGYRHDKLEGIESDTIRGFIGYHFDFKAPLGR